MMMMTTTTTIYLRDDNVNDGMYTCRVSMYTNKHTNTHTHTTEVGSTGGTQSRPQRMRWK